MARTAPRWPALAAPLGQRRLRVLARFGVYPCSMPRTTSHVSPAIRHARLHRPSPGIDWKLHRRLQQPHPPTGAGVGRAGRVPDPSRREPEESTGAASRQMTVVWFRPGSKRGSSLPAGSATSCTSSEGSVPECGVFTTLHPVSSGGTKRVAVATGQLKLGASSDPQARFRSNANHLRDRPPCSRLGTGPVRNRAGSRHGECVARRCRLDLSRVG